jgi:hypothetical protein
MLFVGGAEWAMNRIPNRGRGPSVHAGSLKKAD